MEYETVIFDKTDQVATITLNRPNKLNAVSSRMLLEIYQIIENIRDNGSIRFVIITGSGRAFSSGIDLGEHGQAIEQGQKYFTAYGRRRQKFGHSFMRSLDELDQVTIAALNGITLGAGLALALACDFRIAATEASLGIPEVNTGIFFTWGCTPRLVRLVGPAKAKELIMTGRIVSAGESLNLGLVNKVVPLGELMTTCHQLIATIAARAPLAIRTTKMIVNAVSTPAIGDVGFYEPDLVERLDSTLDRAEAINAFLQKRQPRFMGE